MRHIHAQAVAALHSPWRFGSLQPYSEQHMLAAFGLEPGLTNYESWAILHTASDRCMVRHLQWKRTEIERRSGSPQIYGRDYVLTAPHIDAELSKLEKAFQNQKTDNRITLDGFSCWLRLPQQEYISHNNEQVLELIQTLGKALCTTH